MKVCYQQADALLQLVVIRANLVAATVIDSSSIALVVLSKLRLKY